MQTGQNFLNVLIVSSFKPKSCSFQACTSLLQGELFIRGNNEDPQGCDPSVHSCLTCFSLNNCCTIINAMIPRAYLRYKKMIEQEEMILRLKNKDAEEMFERDFSV